MCVVATQTHSADEPLDALHAEAITEIPPERFRSICRTNWLTEEHMI